MSGRQRQQAVIHRATAAGPDPRRNETSNCKTPITIKIPVPLVKRVGKLIQRLVITTVGDADMRSLPVRTVFNPPRSRGEETLHDKVLRGAFVPVPFLKGESLK